MRLNVGAGYMTKRPYLFLRQNTFASHVLMFCLILESLARCNNLVAPLARRCITRGTWAAHAWDTTEAALTHHWGALGTPLPHT